MNRLPDVRGLVHRAAANRWIIGRPARIAQFLRLAEELVAIYRELIPDSEKLFIAGVIDARIMGENYRCYKIERIDLIGDHSGDAYNVYINLFDSGPEVTIGNCEMEDRGWRKSDYLDSFVRLNAVLVALMASQPE